MILIISTCKEELSEMEFVRPIALIVEDHNVIHCSRVTAADIKTAEKIIIAGTALKDFDYMKHDFSWILELDKPLLGICSGMQIIAKAHGIQLEDFTAIGPQPVETVKENKLASGKFNAYFLHTKTGTGNFVSLAETNGKPCLIKHPEKDIFGCIFHPEVMNEDIVRRFVHTQP